MRYTTIFAAYFLVSVVWTSFGLLMQNRSQNQSLALKQAVAGLWGAPHHQVGPTLRDIQSKLLPIQDSRVQAALNLEFRQKGLFWYSTYTVDFEGIYSFTNRSNYRELWDFKFRLPSPQGMYSGFIFSLDGVDDNQQMVQDGQLQRSIQMEPGVTREVRVAYHSQGCDEWYYNFQNQQSSPTRGLQLQVKTNFLSVDFPEGTLSPTSRKTSATDWVGQWDYHDLITGGQVGIALPHKADAAPQLIDLCLFAPVGLLGFFIVLTTLALVAKIRLHPMHFLLLGAGYFSFHLLLAYLGDLTSLAVAFPVAAAVTCFIELSYLRQVAGSAFALRSGGLALTLYLLLFSATFLAQHRGLPIVVLLLISLHLIMRLTGKIDWATLGEGEASHGA